MTTSACTGFNASAFASLMSQSSDKFSLNLAHATMLEVIDEYIEHKSITHPRFADQWSTTKKYIRGLEFLCGQKIMPNQVSELFYPHLIQYMLQQGCATTTVERTCSQLRASLEWGSRYGAPVSPSYDKTDFNGRCREKTILSYAELCHVYYFDINTLKRPDGKKYNAQWYRYMERVRDMFIFSVIFGQRHSDTVRITKDCFDGDRFSLTQQKTGNKVSYLWQSYAFDVKIARKLLEKYDYTCPYVVSISVYNRRLHELFRAIGQEFDQIVKTEEKILGEIITTTEPRWKMIGSHTARRTAISFWANKGKNMAWIQRFSGHKDLRSLQEYMLEEV